MATGIRVEKSLFVKFHVAMQFLMDEKHLRTRKVCLKIIELTILTLGLVLVLRNIDTQAQPNCHTQNRHRDSPRVDASWQ